MITLWELWLGSLYFRHLFNIGFAYGLFYCCIGGYCCLSGCCLNCCCGNCCVWLLLAHVFRLFSSPTPLGLFCSLVTCRCYVLEIAHHLRSPNLLTLMTAKPKSQIVSTIASCISCFNLLLYFITVQNFSTSILFLMWRQ